MTGPQTLDDCKRSCSTDELKWQWVSFENTTCYCIELLEHGEFNIIVYDFFNFVIKTETKNLKQFLTIVKFGGQTKILGGIW